MSLLSAFMLGQNMLFSVGLEPGVPSNGDSRRALTYS